MRPVKPIEQEELSRLEKAFEAITPPEVRMCITNYFVTGVYLTIRGHGKAGYIARDRAMLVARVPKTLQNRVERCLARDESHFSAKAIASAVGANREYENLFTSD